MTRRVLILDLKDDADLIAAYERHHRPGGVPEGVVRNIRRSGIEAMEIHRSGSRLVMVIETADGAELPANAAEADPDVVAWEELMDHYQQRLPWAPPGVKWLEADLIFDLSEHEGS